MNQPAARSHTVLFSSIAAFIIIADQLSKAWFVFMLGRHDQSGFGAFLGPYFSLWGKQMIQESYFPPVQVVKVWHPWLQWQLTTNTGAAWSMFRGNSIYLSIVSIVIAIALIYVWQRYFSGRLGMTWIFGLIVGGALGNFIDRLRLQEVVDFIDVKFPLIGRRELYDFPIFNVADSAAVCGTICLALVLVAMDIKALAGKGRRKAEPAKQHDPYSGGLEVNEEALQELKQTADEIRRGERFTPRSQTGWHGNIPLDTPGGPAPDSSDEDR
ncbi:signal peptidase II [bacterium]|nr:signal peptidase II [bacterium]